MGCPAGCGEWKPLIDQQEERGALQEESWDEEFSFTYTNKCAMPSSYAVRWKSNVQSRGRTTDRMGDEDAEIGGSLKVGKVGTDTHPQAHREPFQGPFATCC